MWRGRHARELCAAGNPPLAILVRRSYGGEERFQIAIHQVRVIKTELAFEHGAKDLGL
jgi:hypothetical protein